MTSVYVARTATPQRGDVVVLSSPVDGTVLLKRVVATAGERVDVRGGHVEVAGEPVPADPANLAFGGGPDFGPTRVPDGKLLVMGDNRGNSNDGRAFGWVDRDAVLGCAVAVIARHGRLVWIGL